MAFRLRPYCVTVMDNWTPMRMFWTLKGAQKFQDRHRGYAFCYRWSRFHGWQFFPAKQIIAKDSRP